MKINKQIKEIEKEIKEIQENEEDYDNCEYPLVTSNLKTELKLLKQFQKEIKEIQGELGEIHSKRAINEMFKNKFGDEE